MIYVVLFFILSIVGFLNFGRYLDVTSKPVVSDIIVCLDGEGNLERIERSVDLYKNGYSQKNILIVIGGTGFTQKDSKADDRIAYIETLKDSVSRSLHSICKKYSPRDDVH